jgi:phosphate acetyltransferase
MPVKKLTFSAGADTVGVVFGARVPIIVTRRTAAKCTRMASPAVVVLIAWVRAAGPGV